MRSIAMLNQKGGVGKTTTAVNVAAGLARVGRRVLLVDLDPQSHATMHLGVDPAQTTPSVYDVLVNGVAARDALHETIDNLLLMPASIDLVGAELELAERPERELILRAALDPVRDDVDYLVIDCPPSLGTLAINALAAVGEVMIPLQPHFLALQGLGRLLETVTLVRGVLNADLRITGIMLCMYEKGTRLAQEVANDVRGFMAAAEEDDAWSGACVFGTRVRRNIKLAECPSFGQTIYDYAPGSHGAEDYAALTGEILNMESEGAEEIGDQVASEFDRGVIREASRAVETIAPTQDADRSLEPVIAAETPAEPVAESCAGAASESPSG